jgi:hypothetical protein
MPKIQVIMPRQRSHVPCQSRAFRPGFGEFLMKTMILAGFGVLALGVGAASAQGYAGAREPMYGQKWAAAQRAERADALARASEPSAPTRTTPAEKAAREQALHPARGG